MLKYKNLIDEMTLEEKASLMSGKNFWETKSVKRLNIPSIYLADGPHGVRKQRKGADHLGLNPSFEATCFPTAVTMANSWNVELVYELEKRVAEEAIAQRVNIILGPGTNIKRNPLCGRNFEYFSEDPYLAGKLASSYIKGAQELGISSCIKHFACNNQEERRMVYNALVDERALREIYLTPFEIAVKEADVKTIMSSYNIVNGYYTNENSHLMNNILRKEWNYQGLVVTDWGGNNERVEGIKCYNSLEMPSNYGDTDLEIIEAIKEGTLDENILNQNVDYLLDVIFSTQKILENANKDFDIEEHHDFAKQCAEEGIVLLKNNNLLPLRDQKVALIGDFASNPRYQGAGSSLVNPTKINTILEEIKDSGLNYIGYEKGFNRYGKKSQKLIKKAKKISNNSDVIILCMGLDEVTEAEGLDRSSMRINDNQITLLKELSKLNKKIVVVLTCGSAVEIDFDDYADALLLAALPGQAGAKAILNIIEGKISPSGKLSETYPIKYEDIPSSSNFPNKNKHIPYLESIYVGYRYFEKNNIQVKYPFGYGLSYSKFEYSNLNITDDGAYFDIENVGNYLAKEIAQLYIGLKDSNVYRPVKELKGFKKIELKINEKRNVFIPFDDKTFRYYNQKTKKWEIEEGEYDIYIASSSEDIRLMGTKHVEGTTNEYPFNRNEIPNYFNGKVKDVNLNEFSLIYQSKIEESKKIKKERITVDYNTTVMELSNCPSLIGRLIANVVKLVHKFLLLIRKRETANTFVMAVFHLPMRLISRMSKGIVNFKQLDGIIMIFNGHFFKGIKKFFKEGHLKRKMKKLNKEKN